MNKEDFKRQIRVLENREKLLEIKIAEMFGRHDVRLEVELATIKDGLRVLRKHLSKIEQVEN